MQKSVCISQEMLSWWMAFQGIEPRRASLFCRKVGVFFGLIRRSFNDKASNSFQKSFVALNLMLCEAEKLTTWMIQMSPYAVKSLHVFVAFSLMWISKYVYVSSILGHRKYNYNICIHPRNTPLWKMGCLSVGPGLGGGSWTKSGCSHPKISENRPSPALVTRCLCWG